VITGFAAVGIDPAISICRAGLHSTLTIAGVSALMSSIIGIAAYLKTVAAAERAVNGD